MLWYELYSNTLKGMGFKINPYDRCIANKDINGSQCTIIWYIDDNKISHKNQNVLEDILSKLEQGFGKMKTTRGDEHIFLGMNMNFNRKNKCLELDMKE